MLRVANEMFPTEVKSEVTNPCVAWYEQNNTRNENDVTGFLCCFLMREKQMGLESFAGDIFVDRLKFNV